MVITFCFDKDVWLLLISHLHAQILFGDEQTLDMVIVNSTSRN